MTHVVVVGGGYAGVIAANRLTQRDDVAVTLINPRPTFVHRIRLHQVVGGTHDALVDFRKVLSDRVRLLVGAVDRIDPAAREVTLAGGGSSGGPSGGSGGGAVGGPVGYDYLIYAVGSGSARPDVPGAAEHAHPAATLEEARALRATLAEAPGHAPVTVVGAGATGIEIAGELAEEGRDVTLVCGGLLAPALHPRARRSVAGRLARLGATVLDGPGSTVTEVTGSAVRLDDGRELPSAVTVWTVGFGVPDLAARSGLRTDAVGRLLTDETLTSVDDPRVLAAGDAAAPSDLPLRMSCQTATPLGAHAADTVLARLADKRPAPLDIGYFGQCVAVGSRAATLQIAARDDTAKPFHLGGRPAGKIKATALEYLTHHLATEARKPGSFTWRFKDGSRARRLRAKRDEAAALNH
ncbi:FAD-dependent oxidoreductase [Streptomyces sp. OF8]|uniref:FAD-dependent oxidoreductase n=2 Tax=Streptomyces alkaliterrae TaxID=2213162 RepID=A0A5P0YZW0_9ACTN|nr:FAD-dependent oxidoreductase [Streptomyces alkaliterrae]MQS04389.1 FAD-dependent oxidoreductase [Streptomyces alkaliterrae]